jgi:hypothetical protein
MAKQFKIPLKVLEELKRWFTCDYIILHAWAVKPKNMIFYMCIRSNYKIYFVTLLEDSKGNFKLRNDNMRIIKEWADGK